jgi:hypothetical protein
MWHECHGLFFAVGEDFVGDLVDEEIEAYEFTVSTSVTTSVFHVTYL